MKYPTVKDASERAKAAVGVEKVVAVEEEINTKAAVVEKAKAFAKVAGVADSKREVFVLVVSDTVAVVVVVVVLCIFPRQ